MDERHNRIMAYVLDYPEAAAREIATLHDAIGGRLLTAATVSFLIGFLFGLWFF